MSTVQKHTHNGATNRSNCLFGLESVEFFIHNTILEHQTTESIKKYSREL